MPEILHGILIINRKNIHINVFVTGKSQVGVTGITDLTPSTVVYKGIQPCV
jgi:hypothetical protein